MHPAKGRFRVLHIPLLCKERTVVDWASGKCLCIAIHTKLEVSLCTRTQTWVSHVLHSQLLLLLLLLLSLVLVLRQLQSEVASSSVLAALIVRIAADTVSAAPSSCLIEGAACLKSCCPPWWLGRLDSLSNAITDSA